jgi:copper transport protein
MKKFLVSLLVIFSLGIPLAYAHPVILDSSPASSSTAPIGTTQIAIHYSEAIEIDFSAIKVLDNNPLLH